MLVPDTPRWFVMKNRSEKALTVLARLVGETKARITLKEIEESLIVPAHSGGSLLAFGGRVILVGILVSVFQQFVGINAVLYYAPLMFKNLGASTDSALWQTVIVGVANVIFTVAAILTVDRVGRKPLLIIGGLVMGLAMVTLGFQFQANAVGLGPLIAAIAYIAGFALSWGPVAWVVLSEIFPNSVKSKALAIAVAAQWIANLFVAWSFKILIGNSALNAMFNHGFPYWVYGVMSFLAAAFVYLYVPETKRRSLEEIQNLWSRGDERAPATVKQPVTG
jgi:SP family xylose:H+ symportor-like MFS transporter